MNILTIDIGGTNIKFMTTGQSEVTKFPSGPTMTAERMVDEIKRLTQGWPYEKLSIGYPGPVVNDRPVLEPKNLAAGWVGFDFAAHFGRPLRIINDAAMQALGSYEGGRMLFLGLGTGLGSALVLDNVVVPLELAHLVHRKKRTFEDNVGARGLERLGKKKWREAVADVVRRLQAAMGADYVVLGGGNSELINELPPGARLGDNKNAFIGGERLWQRDDGGHAAFRHQGEVPSNDPLHPAPTRRVATAH